MNRLEDRKISCPYCGEIIEVVIDCSEPHQTYTEDCQVCCQPMVVDVVVDPDGDPWVTVLREDD